MDYKAGIKLSFRKPILCVLREVYCPAEVVCFGAPVFRATRRKIELQPGIKWNIRSTFKCVSQGHPEQPPVFRALPRRSEFLLVVKGIAQQPRRDALVRLQGVRPRSARTGPKEDRQKQRGRQENNPMHTVSRKKQLGLKEESLKSS